MNYTNNYHLPQWAETDRIMMEDFNQAFSDIDEGIKAISDAAYTPDNKPYVVGSYTGNGGTQTITLGFQPSFVIITAQLANTQDTSFIAISGGNEASSTLTFTSNGFTVMKGNSHSETYPLTNQNGRFYHYLALR